MFALGGTSVGVVAEIGVALDAGWQVDAMFGGALLRTAATALRTASGFEDWIAVDASARFLRPLLAGDAVARVEVVRLGRRTCVAAVQLVQGGRVALAALITLAPADAVPFAAPGEPAALPPVAPIPAGPLGAVAAQVDWRVVGEWGPAVGPLEAWIAPRDATAPPAADWCLVAADLLVPALPGASRGVPLRLASVALDVSLRARPSSVWLAQSVEAERAGDAAHAVLRLSAPGGGVVAQALHRAVLLPAVAAEMPFCATAFGAGVVDAVR